MLSLDSATSNPALKMLLPVLSALPVTVLGQGEMKTAAAEQNGKGTATALGSSQ